MFFNTIDEYDKELGDIKSTMDSMEKRLDKEPYSSIRKGNYRGLQELYNIIRQDRDYFLKMRDENINLHIYGEKVNDHKISLNIIIRLFKNFHDLTNFLFEFVKNELKFTFESRDLKVVSVGKGSVQIVCCMDENITDLNEVYLYLLKTNLISLLKTIPVK